MFDIKKFAESVVPVRYGYAIAVEDLSSFVLDCINWNIVNYKIHDANGQYIIELDMPNDVRAIFNHHLVRNNFPVKFYDLNKSQDPEK